MIIPGLLIEHVLIGGDQFPRPYTFHSHTFFIEADGSGILEEF